MADILDRFIEAAKQNVASGYYSIADSGRKSKKVSLKEKLAKQFVLITEIKHASPAGEYSFDSIDVRQAARDFAACGADAISVVVEQQIFKGNLGNVAIAKETGLPVLFKDFVISERQIEAAAACGADCVLLVAKVAARMSLDLDALIARAHEKGLEVLLECYDGKEMQMAVKTDADILGINNRDLATLKVDLERTKRIMGTVGKIEKPVISESGIRNAIDVRFVRKFGVDGVLVGTSIWKAGNLREKVKELKSGAV